jgi:hypothetical protein
MITLTLLAVLGVALASVIWMMARAPSGPALPPAAPKPAPRLPTGTPSDLWNARKGDVISVKHAAEDYSDIDFPVDRRSSYASSGTRWIDLSGDYRGDRVYLEVHEGHGAEIMGILNPRKLTIADLQLTEDQLAAFDAKQDPNQTITFEGKQWHYESSREIGYFENEQGSGEGVYRWLFREPNGPRLICIEKWVGEPFDVRLAVRLNPQDVAVYPAA